MHGAGAVAVVGHADLAMVIVEGQGVLDEGVVVAHAGGVLCIQTLFEYGAITKGQGAKRAHAFAFHVGLGDCGVPLVHSPPTTDARPTLVSGYSQILAHGYFDSTHFKPPLLLIVDLAFLGPLTYGSTASPHHSKSDSQNRPQVNVSRTWTLVARMRSHRAEEMCFNTTYPIWWLRSMIVSSLV